MVGQPDPSIPTIPLPPTFDCPFCGSPAQLKSGLGNVFLVQCSACPAEMMGIGAETVLSAWNRRVVLAGKPEIPGT